MLKLLLLTASVLLAQNASMDCSNMAATETRAMPGPGGASTVLRVASSDDGGRNTHSCIAKYELAVNGAGLRPPTSAVLLWSDGDWGRQLSVHLDGFSRDGRRVFGIVSENGKYPLAKLFDYHVEDGKVTLVELKTALRVVAGAKCSDSLAVAGITASGAIVLRPDTTAGCQANYRWQVSAGGRLRRVSPGRPILGLYGMDAK